MRIKCLLILFSLAFGSCLKAKKSPFDISSKSPTSSIIVGRALAGTTSTSSSSSSSTTTATTVAPSNLVYSVTALQSKLIPGNTTTITPTITGTVTSWTISPSTLPPGVTFDSTTGVITCSPPIGSAAFPLTNFTVTAINPGGNTSFTVPLQVLASGDNVWTVISGVSGQDVGVAHGGLMIDKTTNSTSLYTGGQVIGNMDGVTSPAPANLAAFISKYDLDGNRSWTRMLGVSGANTNGPSIQVDPSGNVYVTGDTSGNLDGNTLIGSPNAFVSKFDSAGTKQWTKTKGSSGSYVSGIAIAVDSAGNSFLVGETKGTLDDGAVNTGAGDSGLTFVKYNTSGTWQASRTIGHSTGGTARHMGGQAIVIDSTGNIWAGGMSKSGVNCASPDLSQTAAIFKFTSSTTYTGTCTGVNTSGGNTFIFGMAVDSSDNIYAVGYTDANTFDSITKNSSYSAGVNYDAFLIKFNASTGTKAWTRLYGVSGATSTKAYAVTISGGYLYLTGETNGNLNSETKNGSIDMFIIKYELSTDTVKWTKLVGSSGKITVGQGLTFDSNKTMYGVGATNGDLYGTTNSTKPNYSMFITRFVQ